MANPHQRKWGTVSYADMSVNTRYIRVFHVSSGTVWHKDLSGQDPDLCKLPYTNKIEGKTTGVWWNLSRLHFVPKVLCRPPCFSFWDSVVFSPLVCFRSVPVTAYSLGEQSIRCSPNHNPLWPYFATQSIPPYTKRHLLFSFLNIFFREHIFDRLYFHFWRIIFFCFFSRESPMDISFPFKFWVYPMPYNYHLRYPEYLGDVSCCLDCF